MNMSDLETRLQQALSIAAPPRSIVDDVMQQLHTSPPQPALLWRRRTSILIMSLAAPVLIIALVALFFLTSGAARLTLADVKAAVERQAWVHVRFDAGPRKESWTNLRTGEEYWIGVLAAGPAGDHIVFINPQANTRLWYWKESGVIRQDAPGQYPPGQGPQPWTPETAWQAVVAPLEREVDATKRAKASPVSVSSAPDVLNGKPAIRFDTERTDALGNRFLYQQLWADPHSHLPVRVRTRLQLAYREKTGKEWSMGDYDFPTTGPADLYALGVPRGTPIVKEVTAAPEAVEPILKAINKAHDNFLKRYRALVWAVRDGSGGVVDELDIVWRDGDRLRQDHHLPQFEVQKTHAPLPAPIAADLLAWAAKFEPSQKQLMDIKREYIWTSADAGRTAKPLVQVMSHGNFPLLAASSWPEQIQWPTRYFSPDFRLLAPNSETPPGCIGLRRGGEGKDRTDYYVDAASDYVCVKQTAWTKRGTEWVKSREYTLSDLHRAAGHIVAAKQHLRLYGDPAQRISESAQMTNIEIVPLEPNEYPPGIFDPTNLTRGADVTGY